MAGVTGQFDDCEDAPREVDLLTEEHIEDLLDAVECLRGKVEQLQVQCEKLMYEKGQLEDQVIQYEKDSMDKETYYEKQLSSLRKLNTELMSQVESKQDSNEIPSWVKTSLDAEIAINDKLEAEKEVISLQIVLREKDKQISNLEWQVMDAESTVTSIQAERDRLAVELDCMLAREEENLESYQDYSDDRNVFSDDEYDNPKLQHSHKKHARRHLSDLTRREDSQINDFTDFVRNGRHVSTLSNNDVPSAADAEFLGGLKRTTNFSNINNMDEFTDFHQNNVDGHNSQSLDFSVSCPSTILKSLSSNSNWHSFGSDSDSGVLPSKNNQSESWDLCDLPSNQPLNEGAYEEGCFDDASDWALDAQPAPLGSLVSCKNGSCRSSSSAYFSDNSTGQDPWTFTPDSIIDVSTGEEIKVTPSGSKNSLGSDSEANNLQPGKVDISKHQDTLHQAVSDAVSENAPTVKDELDSSIIQKESITLPQDDYKHGSKSSERNGIIKPTKDEAFCEGFERTASVRSDGAMASTSKEPVHHQRINSEPLPQSPTRSLSEGKEGVIKLQAYQKWRLSGKKGHPPAKLKISQC